MLLPDPPIRAKERLPDPQMGERKLFPHLRSDVYLNHAAISPPSLHVRHMLDAVPNSFSELGTDAFGIWVAQRNRLRETLATLIGAQSEDIGLVPNTSMGLISIAMCLDWRPGDRILLFEGEFPTNITPWQRAALHFDLKLRMLSLAGFHDRSGSGLEQFEQALQEGCRLVAVSAVQFQTGLAMPLEDMARLCRKYDAMLCVDGIQAVGCLPIDVETMKVDFLVSGSHKWLMGMEGCGFLYISPERMRQLVPRMAGWLSHEDGLGFLFNGAGHLRYDRPIRQRADWVEVGAQNSIGFAALEASVDLLVDLGITPIYQHIQQWIDQIEPAMLEMGFQSMRHPASHGRSGILSMKTPQSWDLITLFQHLNRHGIAVSTPDGFLRMAPHWPNSLSEVDRVISAVKAFTP